MTVPILYKQKFFGSFFQKRTAFFAYLSTTCRLVLFATLPTSLAVQFGFQASVVVLVLAALVPPFENPDEFNHMNRVDEISRGGIIATRYGGPHTSGGKVDTGINRIDAMVGTVRFHPERKVTRAMILDANAVRWGSRARTTFANTSIYAPFLYFGAVFGDWVGKLRGFSIARTLIICRAITGLTNVLAASLAIGFAGEAAPFLFIVLSLPMSLFLFACVSQDGPMLALSAAAIAIVAVLQKEPEKARKLRLAALCVCLALVGIGRPAYATFCALPLLLPHVALRHRIIGAAAAVSAIAGWSLAAAHWSMINAEAYRGVDPAAQLQSLAAQPWMIVTLARSIVTGPQGMEGATFYREMVGILGWQDVILPDWFYPIAGCALAGSIIAILPREKPLLPWWAQGALFLAAFGAVALVFLLEYLSWTPLRLPIVQGVQGRYFLPIVLFLPGMLPGVRSAVFACACGPIRIALLAFPALSAAVTVTSVVRRYYL